MSDKTNPAVEELTQNQINELREKQLVFMKDQIEYLNIQSQYTKLKAEISENVFNEFLYKVKVAQLKFPAQEPGSDFDIDKEK